MLLIIISPPVEFDGNLSAFKLNSIIVDVSSVSNGPGIGSSRENPIDSH